MGHSFKSFIRLLRQRIWRFFLTVDIREEAAADLRPKLSEHSQSAVDDSVEFLASRQLPKDFINISLAYLESYDLDIDDPEPSMQHGLSGFNAAHPLLGRNSILVVDDTPVESCLLGETAEVHVQKYGFVPGKGALIIRSPLIHQ